MGQNLVEAREANSLHEIKRKGCKISIIIKLNSSQEHYGKFRELTQHREKLQQQRRLWSAVLEWGICPLSLCCECRWGVPRRLLRSSRAAFRTENWGFDTANLGEGQAYPGEGRANYADENHSRDGAYHAWGLNQAWNGVRLGERRQDWEGCWETKKRSESQIHRSSLHL